MRVHGLVNKNSRTKASANEALASRMHRGFTLIELMIVVGIVGILSAVTVPNVSKIMRRSESGQVIEMVRSTMIDVRNRARNSERCVGISFAATSISYQVYDSSKCAGASPVGAAQVIPMGLLDNGRRVSGFTLSGAAYKYDGHGSIDGNTQQTVSVSTEYGSKNYTVWPAIGSVRSN